MPDHSFGIANAVDLFHLLEQHTEDYLKDLVSPGKAILCAMLAWHLCDWAFKESCHKDLGAFRARLVEQCQSLIYMGDITNGTKHCSLNRKHKVVDTRKRGGTFGPGFSRRFDIGHLEFELQDGTKLLFDLELEKVVAFWKSYFAASE